MRLIVALQTGYSQELLRKDLKFSTQSIIRCALENRATFIPFVGIWRHFRLECGVSPLRHEAYPSHATYKEKAEKSRKKAPGSSRALSLRFNRRGWSKRRAQESKNLGCVVGEP
jgi:hypothetical protein